LRLLAYAAIATLASARVIAATTQVLNFDSNTPVAGAWVIGVREESAGLVHANSYCAEVRVAKSDSQGNFSLGAQGSFEHFNLYFYRKGYWQTSRRTAMGSDESGLSIREADSRFANLDPVTARIAYLNKHAAEMSCAGAPREQRHSLLLVYRDMYAEARALARTSEEALRAQSLCREMFWLTLQSDDKISLSDFGPGASNAYLKGAAPECLEPIDDADQQRFVRAFNDRDFDTLSGLVKSGFDVNRLVFNDNPAIVMAARYGDPQRIAALASFGAKVDLTGSENESALFLAVKQPSLEKTRKLATVSALLDAGANPNLRSAGGSSPVLWAVTVDDLELLTLLLDHRGSPNQRVECQIYCLDRNRSALSFARSPAVAELLIRRGASATYRDAEGRGLLDYAFNPDIVKALIAAGADVNEVDVGGWTPLMHVLQAYAQNPAPARRASYKAIATILVNSGARLDIKNQWGLDALYYSGDESFNRELRQLAAPH